MNKLLMFLMLFYSFSINAQVRNYTKKSTASTKIKKASREASNRKLGVSIGYQFSNEKSASDIGTTTARKSIYGGINYTFLSKDSFLLESHLLYSNMGAVFNDKYLDKLDYIQLPIYFQPKLGTFVIKAGPQIGYLIKGQYNGVDYEGDLNKIDYGLAAIIGFTIKNNLEISFKYYYGLANTYSNNSFDPIKNNSMGLAIAYKIL